MKEVKHPLTAALFLVTTKYVPFGYGKREYYRSKQAAEKLRDLGYTNVIESGGIKDWNGEVEK